MAEVTTPPRGGMPRKRLGSYSPNIRSDESVCSEASTPCEDWNRAPSIRNGSATATDCDQSAGFAPLLSTFVDDSVEAHVSDNLLTTCCTPPADGIRRVLFQELKAPAPRRISAAASPPSPPPLNLLCEDLTVMRKCQSYHSSRQPSVHSSGPASQNCPCQNPTSPSRLTIAGFLRDLRVKENVYLSSNQAPRLCSSLVNNMHELEEMYL